MKGKSNISITKIILLAVLVIASVLTLVCAINSMLLMNADSFKQLDSLVGEGTTSSIKAGFWSYLAMTIGLSGVWLAIVLKVFYKESLLPYVLLGAGSLALILFFVAIGANFEHIDALKAAAKAAEALKGTPMEIAYKAASSAYNKELILPVINILIFAVTPMALGLKKLLDR